METKETYVKVGRLNPDKPIVVYSGSMIQQNHGEKPFGHGYVLWDVKNRSATHQEVHNDYGYYTITVRNGKCVSDLSLLPNKARLRVKVFNTTAAETKVIIADIRKRTSITDLNVTRCDAISEAKKFDRDNRFNFGDVSKTEVQNQLIEDYLSRNFVVSDEQIKTILEINKEVNGKLEVKEVLRNCVWKPKKFEFGNMFSYGEGNVVDFTNMKSVMGLFASNALNPRENSSDERGVDMRIVHDDDGGEWIKVIITNDMEELVLMSGSAQNEQVGVPSSVCAPRTARSTSHHTLPLPHSPHHRTRNLQRSMSEGYLSTWRAETRREVNRLMEQAADEVTANLHLPIPPFTQVC